MTKGNCAPTNEAPPRKTCVVILKRIPRLSVIPVNLFPSSSRPILNTPADSIGSSIMPSLPMYSASSPYEKYLKELFDGVAPSDVRPNFMATPVKQNNLPIKEYESAIFYSGIANGYSRDAS
ncbi:hypothetical protein MKX01_004284 [Papaver californicum]|nr:hypothetical protein MKX01_004284 [Papaver californicum]